MLASGFALLLGFMIRRSNRCCRKWVAGMNLAAAIGMCIGTMCAARLRLPLTSILLAVVLTGVDGVLVTPQVVVAVAVAFVISTLLPVPGPKTPQPPPSTQDDARNGDAAADAGSRAT